MSIQSRSTCSDPTASPAEMTSLAALKGAHRGLLEKNQGGARDPNIRGEILDFIFSASALGARLSSLDDRVEAQRMLDYWGAFANTGAKSVTRTATESISKSALESIHESFESGIVPAVLADYQDVGEADAAGKADELYNGASEGGRTLFKRLFLGFIALEENGTSFRLVPRTAAELTAKLAAPAGETQPHEWLSRLVVTTGIVRQHEDGTYTLVGPSVMDQWKLAGNWMAQRRRLRGAARFWEEHGKDSTALLEPGELLDEADGYLDLTPQEKAFVDGSKTAGMEKRTRKWKFIGAVAGVGVFALLVALFIALYGLRQSKQKYKEADQAFTDADKARTEAVAKLLEAQRDFAKAKTEMDEAKKQRVSAEEKLNLSEQNLKEAAARRDDAISFAKAKEEEVAKLNERREKLTQDLDTLLATSSFPPEARKKIVDFRDKLVADNQAPQSSPPGPASQGSIPAVLQPGSGIMMAWSGEKAYSIATAGVFLRKPGNTEAYLLMPGMMLSGRASSEAFAIRSLTDSTENAPRLFSTPANPSYGTASSTELFAVPIVNPVPTLKVENITVNGVNIRGVASPVEILTGTTVTLIGLGSGVKQGEITSYDREQGLFRTTRISTLGDAGAPVITQDNKLVGILMGRDPESEERSLVIAAQPFLAKNGFTLDGDDAAAPTPTKWTAVMGEILVSGDSPEFSEKAKTYVDLLRAEGIHMPIPAAQPRKRVPSKTEVRYFRAEDKALAGDIIKLLKDKGGVKENQMRPSFVDDPTVPPKFIQISMAKDLLIPPGAQPRPR